ncbi:hypothetical protein C1645_825699 [Glomus cerebriforme]|uniref:BZIP domain-containing protein n=1 Tax=Glomus cerebriforme TaxID=658196 RepID=A0A397SXZ6_9GLOM|nr:hypothetical protein C1645_825699 [Glomus cerebriforme]
MENRENFQVSTDYKFLNEEDFLLFDQYTTISTEKFSSDDIQQNQSLCNISSSSASTRSSISNNIIKKKLQKERKKMLNRKAAARLRQKKKKEIKELQDSNNNLRDGGSAIDEMTDL